MNILALDFETTGLDPEYDKIIEVGAIVYNTQHKHIIHTFSDLVVVDKELPDVVALKTNINTYVLMMHGVPLKESLTKLKELIDTYKIEYFMGHNGRSFDSKFLEKACLEHDIYGLNLPWIDTRFDIEYPDAIETRRLDYLAAEHGFINPFPHRALFDCMTMIKILERYDFVEVLDNSKIKDVVVEAVVSFANKDQAKEAKYMWQNCGDKVFPKKWVKQIKANKLGHERSKRKFEVNVVWEES